MRPTVVDLPWSTWPMKTMLRWGLFAIEGAPGAAKRYPYIGVVSPARREPAAHAGVASVGRRARRGRGSVRGLLGRQDADLVAVRVLDHPPPTPLGLGRRNGELDAARFERRTRG